MKIVLVGFMGAGKTTVGKLVAQRLNLPFIDTDSLIQSSAGMSTEEIFRREGEEGFRRRERRAISQAAGLRQAVVATGGGAYADPQNRRLLEEDSRVIWLDAPAETLHRRLQNENRPLLEGGQRRRLIDELLQARRSSYRLADERVDTSGLSPSEAADRITAGLSPAADPPAGEYDRISIQTKQRSYRIIVGCDLFAQLADYLREASLHPKRVGVISDALVWEIYGEKLSGALREDGIEPVLWTFPPGEGSKGQSQLEKIYGHFLSLGISRDIPMLAFGGGVTGDLAGFAAATLLRGLPYVQIPTTLLAQVDSSVGGKVAINHPAGKNLIGAFHQPCLVLCDVGFLGSLSSQQYRSGLAEVFKYGLLVGGDYLQMLTRREEDIFRRDPAVLRPLVSDSCRIKRDYVQGDERDLGRRMMLNLGHTAGHAVESLAGGRLPHGIAVAFGLAVAARLSRRLGCLPESTCRFITDLLGGWGFPTTLEQLPVDCRRPEEIVDRMQADKKSRGGTVRWVLLRDVGEAFLSGEVPDSAVTSALKGETS